MLLCLSTVILTFSCRLMRCIAEWDECCPSNVVDLYNSATGTWSTAQLSVARDRIAATSVGNVALFAGGYIQGSLVQLRWDLQVAAFAAVLRQLCPMFHC